MKEHKDTDCSSNHHVHRMKRLLSSKHFKDLVFVAEAEALSKQRWLDQSKDAAPRNLTQRSDDP